MGSIARFAPLVAKMNPEFRIVSGPPNSKPNAHAFGYKGDLGNSREEAQEDALVLRLL
jgi:hypothetical protein